MGKHRLPRGRRTSRWGLAAVVAPVAVICAAATDTASRSAPGASDPAPQASPCCLELVDAAPAAPAAAAPQAVLAAAHTEPGTASRWRVVRPRIHEALPVGKAPEQGLQVKTILAARAISAAFPQIQQIGGVRPDALRWHPNGLALDVMIPNPTSAEGIRLGNAIVAFVLENAERLGLQDAIWRGVYYRPSGPRGSAAGHYDHVHITTTGGGYPTGNEVYLREVVLR
ncbi:hypothetical protein [uncultured Mycolicibacterium sp.]|mgnify:FL=1|uniref:hypothetical protein n=1 Tax=uncultured Mycolicibacterium sp. TaxID=2320817 RepID=UPI0026198DD9|nr:hypothetical protein [uncultured Mycolicibacterium sp.]